jgi:hypothetical protein
VFEVLHLEFGFRLSLSCFLTIWFLSETLKDIFYVGITFEFFF